MWFRTYPPCLLFLQNNPNLHSNQPPGGHHLPFRIVGWSFLPAPEPTPERYENDVGWGYIKTSNLLGFLLLF